MSERIHAWPIYDIFDTADGHKLFVGVTTEGNWLAFCRAFGFEQFLADPTLQTVTDRIDARDRTLPVIAERLGRENSADLQGILDRLSIPFSQINAPVEMFDDPHVQRPGGLVDVVNIDGAVLRIPALPLEMAGVGIDTALAVPMLGSDTADILAELGYTADEIAALEARTLKAG